MPENTTLPSPSTEEQSAFSSWEESYRIQHQRRYQINFDLYENHTNGGRVLEIGATPFHFSKILVEAGVDLTAIDPSPERVNEEYFEGMQVFTADVETQPLPFSNGEFDTVLLMDVIEHFYVNPLFALREIARVMKPGGRGIFQVPLDTNNPNTEEDKNVTDPKERERLYWQDDHLRLFGLDYGKKLAAAGFKVTESDFINELSPELVERYALPKDEIVYFCRKL